MSRVQSIERAFAVLGALADGPLGVTEVADGSRCRRAPPPACSARSPTRAPSSRCRATPRYRLGPRIVTLAAGVRPTRSLVALARPHLVELAGAAGEAAGLSVPDGASSTTSTRSTARTRSRSATGPARASRCMRSRRAWSAWPSLRPGRSTLPGRAARALHAADRRRRRAPSGAAPRVQLDGYAWARDEFADGITSVAAAVADADGEVVAAIHVHGPSYRFPALGAGGGAERGGRDGGGTDLGEPAPAG